MASRVPPAWVVGPLLAARNAIGRVHRALGPPELVLVERSLGVADTKALAVVAELDVADRLATGPRHADELADVCGVDADALGRVLRYLVGRGVFDRDAQGRYRNNRVSALLQSRTERSMRSWARFFGSRAHVDAWNHLDHSVATGESAFVRATGASFWEHLRRHPDERACFAEAMEDGSRLQADLIAAKYDFGGCRTVCDVGGGTGTVLARILAAHPSLDGVLLELPEVAATAAPVLRAAGVADRVRIVGGDFFTEVPAGCDRYVLQAVVHDWDDASVTRILGQVRAAMAPTARVLVLEQPVPKGNGDHFVKAFDLEMLVDTGAGRERTVEEYGALFAAAGFHLHAVRPIAVSTLFELVPGE